MGISQSVFFLYFTRLDFCILLSTTKVTFVSFFFMKRIATFIFSNRDRYLESSLDLYWFRYVVLICSYQGLVPKRITT